MYLATRQNCAFITLSMVLCYQIFFTFRLTIFNFDYRIDAFTSLAFHGRPSVGASARVEVDFDPETSTRLQEIIEAKTRALNREEYDAVQQCDATILRLATVGRTLPRLEEQQRHAVVTENFATARALEAKVAALRELLRSPPTPPLPPPPPPRPRV